MDTSLLIPGSSTPEGHHYQNKHRVPNSNPSEFEHKEKTEV